MLRLKSDRTENGTHVELLIGSLCPLMFPHEGHAKAMRAELMNRKESPEQQAPP